MKTKITGSHLFLIVSFLLLLLNCRNVSASHILGAEIYYTHDTGSAYIVTVLAYEDCGASSNTGPNNILATTSEGCSGMIRTYSGGHCCTKDITPRAAGICDLCSDPKCSYSFGVSQVTITAKFGLPSGCCNYVFNWEQCCLKTATTGSFWDFYIESRVNICVAQQNSPVYQFEPPTIICVDQAFDRSVTVYPGNEDDSIYYHFTDPLSGPGSPYSYNSPYTVSTPLIYSGTDPDATYSAPLCLGMHYDHATGRMNFKATKTDITMLSVRADEYHIDTTGKYVLAGTTMRSCMLIIKVCDNNHPPIITGINGGSSDTMVTCSNVPLNFYVNAFDLDKSDTVSMTSLNETPGSVSISGNKWPVATFKWTPQTKDVRPRPYAFTLTAKDNASPLPGLVQKRIFIWVKDSFPTQVALEITDSGCGKYHFSISPSAKGYHLIYKWYINNILVSDLAEFTYSTSVANKYQVTLVLSDGGGCSKTLTGDFEYDASYQLSQRKIETCVNVPSNLYSGKMNHPRWSPPDGLNNADIISPVATVNKTTVYTVEGTDQNGCRVRDSVQVFVKDFIEKISGNNYACPGQSAGLKVTGGTNWFWWPSSTLNNNNNASVSASPTQPTWYFVNVSDTPTGCSKIDSFYVKIGPPAVRYPDLMLCKGNNISLNAANGSKFFWTPSTYLDNVTYPSPVSTPVATILYRVLITDGNSKCTRTDTQLVIVDNDCRWPGDANKDKIADYLDVLQIGVGAGTSGPSGPGTKWLQYPSLSWKESNGNGLNYKHFDCNGDGLINAADTAVITLNYGKTHKKWTPGKGDPADPPIYFKFVKDTFYSGETAIAYLYAGSANKPLTNSYGIGYQCGSGGSPVVEKTDLLTPVCDFFCTAYQINYIHTGTVGSFDATTVQTTGANNQNTTGQLGVLRFGLKDSKNFKYSPKGDKIYAKLYSATVIDHTGKEINVYGLNDTAIVLANPSGIDPASYKTGVKIYPNPAKESFTIESSNSKIEKLSLFNSVGQCVLNVSPSSERFRVDVSSLPNGIYFISINDALYSADWKIVVQR